VLRELWNPVAGDETAPTLQERRQVVSLEEAMAMERHESHMEQLEAAASAVEKLSEVLPKCAPTEHELDLMIVCRRCGEFTGFGTFDPFPEDLR
jgi:hypothetical protein